MKRLYLIIIRNIFEGIIIGTCVVGIILLSLVPTGCDSDTGAYNISPRDAAIEKAEAWERKRYEDILNQQRII